MPLTFVTEVYDPPIKEIECWKYFNIEEVSATAVIKRQLIDIMIVKPSLQFPVNAYKGSKNAMAYVNQWITADGDHTIQSRWARKWNDGELLHSEEVTYGFPRGFCQVVDVKEEETTDMDGTKEMVKIYTQRPKIILRPGFCVFDSEIAADEAASSFGSSSIKIKIQARDIIAKGFNGNTGYNSQQFALALQMFIPKDAVFEALQRRQKIYLDAAKERATENKLSSMFI